MLTSRIFARARPVIARTWAVQTRQLAQKTRVVERELPPATPKSRRSWIIGGTIVGAAVWIVGLSSALNFQRLSSSVVTGTLFMVRYDPRVIELLGPQIDYADQWPWIAGTVNHFKGKVAISFDIAGANGERGRVRFAALRRGEEWSTVEFTVMREEDGKTIDLGTEIALTDKGAPSMA